MALVLEGGPGEFGPGIEGFADPRRFAKLAFPHGTNKAYDLFEGPKRENGGVIVVEAWRKLVVRILLSDFLQFIGM